MNSFESARENKRIHAMTDDQFQQWLYEQERERAAERDFEIGG